MNAAYSYAQIKTNMQLIYSKQNLEFIVMQKIIYDENSQAENWIMHNIHYWSNVALVRLVCFWKKCTSKQHLSDLKNTAQQ